MTKDIDSLVKKIGLSPARVEGLIYLFSQSINNQDLLITTGLAKSILDDFRMEIGDYLLPSSKKTFLNPKGQLWVKKIKPKPFNWQIIDLEKMPSDLSNLFDRYQKERFEADRKIDQFRATKETVWNRVAIMNQNGDLDNHRLLFLGDADWVAVAAAYLKQAKRIFVVEIDERVVNDLKKISQENNLKIEILKHDLKRPLPNHLLNNFDLVFSDPPYTANGVSLFLSRSIEALDEKSSSRVYFCYGQSDRARERSLEIQRLLSQLGLLIEECRPKFNRYFGAASIGSSSSLYINSLTVKTKPTIVGQFTGPIYTWQK